VGSLAAHAAIALQERRLRGVHVEVEPEVLRRDPCREAISRLHERPVGDLADARELDLRECLVEQEVRRDHVLGGR